MDPKVRGRDVTDDRMSRPWLLGRDGCFSVEAPILYILNTAGYACLVATQRPKTDPSAERARSEIDL